MSSSKRQAAGIALIGSILFMVQGCARPEPLDITAERQEIIFYKPGETAVRRTMGEYPGADGARLGYIHYQPPGPSRNTAIVYLHGIQSHAGWFKEAAYLLAGRGYDVYSLDRRGSGINRENRGFATGDMESFQILLDDVHAFTGQIRQNYSRLVLTGLSWGGKLALACALAHPGTIDALVLITPGLAALVDLNWQEKAKLAMMLLGRQPETGFNIPIKPHMFTPDPRVTDQIRRDPLRLHKVTARFLIESRRLDHWIAERIIRNRTPMQVFLAGQDQIVDNQKIITLLGRGSQPLLAIYLYEDLTHSIQLEAAGRLVADMDSWISETCRSRFNIKYKKGE